MWAEMNNMRFEGKNIKVFKNKYLMDSKNWAS